MDAPFDGAVEFLVVIMEECRERSSVSRPTPCADSGTFDSGCDCPPARLRNGLSIYGPGTKIPTRRYAHAGVRRAPARRTGSGAVAAHGAPDLVSEPPLEILAGSRAGDRAEVGSLTGSLGRGICSDRELREALRRFLERLHVPNPILFDLVLASGEAMTNAIRYGLGNEVSWSVVATVDEIRVELCYQSERFETAPAPSRSSGLEERGRGIILMRLLMDDLRYQFQQGDVRVLLIKRRSHDEQTLHK